LKDIVDCVQIGDLASEFDRTDLVTNTLQEVLKGRDSPSLYGRSADVSRLAKKIAGISA
jgi:hypothetical protein